MANYTYNNVGSATIIDNPTKFKKNDTLRFNITNTDTTTKYKGTILSYTFPHDCTVAIEACGACGGIGTTAGKSGQLYGYGAKVNATIEFKAGDQLLLLVGQAGTNSGNTSTSDRTTGAGGGATYLVIRDNSSSYTFVGSANSNSDGYNGWKVTPLIIAAGGNGARDIAYSGTGTIYGGQGFTDGAAEALGTTSTSSTQLVAGSFSKEIGSKSSNNSSYRYGRSFLQGGLGSMYHYTRTSTSYAGFGGGAANADDGDGGGGGGWVSGYKSAAAKSYCTTNATDRSSVANTNNGEGYILFTIVKVPSVNFRSKISGSYKNTSLKCKISGSWKNVNSGFVKVGGVWKPLN